MARTQAKVLSSIWTDPDFTGLSSGAQRLYLLLLSQPKLTLAGSLDLMPERWAKLASDTTPHDVERALVELIDNRCIVVHDDELVIRTFVAHDLATGAINSNLVKGMWSAWGGLMSPPLRKVVVDEMPPRVFGREGIEVPDEASKLRSEPRLKLPLEPRFEPRFGPETAPSEETAGQTPEKPRFEPQLEPQSEPSVDLLPATCCPPTSTSSENHSTTPVDQPSTPVVDDQQTFRRCVAAVALIEAGDRSTDGGWVAGIRKRILTDPDDDRRERIRDLVARGHTPDTIADVWAPPAAPAVDEFGLPVPAASTDRGPDTRALYEAAEQRRRDTQAAYNAEPVGDPVAGLAAARAAAKTSPVHAVTNTEQPIDLRPEPEPIEDPR